MDSSAGLCAAERDLQLAIRTGDLDVLGRLLDDRFVHVGPDGAPQDKHTMLAARATGAMRIRRLEEEALEAVVDGTTGITRATVTLSGHAGYVLYSCRMVVTRTWVCAEGRWTVLAEHTSLVEPADQRVVALP